MTTIIRHCSNIATTGQPDRQTRATQIGKYLARLVKLVPKNAPDFADKSILNDWITELLTIDDNDIVETCKKIKLSYSEFPSLAKFMQECGAYLHPEAAIALVTSNIVQAVIGDVVLLAISRKVLEKCGGLHYFARYDTEKQYELQSEVTRLVRAYQLPLMRPSDVAPPETLKPIKDIKQTHREYCDINPDPTAVDLPLEEHFRRFTNGEKLPPRKTIQLTPAERGECVRIMNKLFKEKTNKENILGKFGVASEMFNGGNN